MNMWPTTDAEREAFKDWQAEVANGDTLRGFREWLYWAIDCEEEFGDDTTAPNWMAGILDTDNEGV